VDADLRAPAAGHSAAAITSTSAAVAPFTAVREMFRSNVARHPLRVWARPRR